MKNITLLVTYWNEKEWVDVSLKQIKKINPKKIIICDGCFDSRKLNKSTDGTREIVQDFIRQYEGEAFFFEAIRVNKWKSIKKLADAMCIDGQKTSLGDYYWAIRHTLRTNPYRINQAITFSMMLKKARVSVGDWFMTIDADQFYSDSMIESLEELSSCQSDYQQICADEYTFFENFEYYSDTYEKRKWNNMPYQMVKGARLLPTRDFKIKTSIFKVEDYHSVVKSKAVGNYFHYKFRKDIERISSGYELGDRKAPEKERAMSTKFFTEKH
ncbi:hypothetical protein D9A24_24790, partial [Vibrio parahaemolyticus]|nr:hypothetical protein [Vibrio parahaemolyticus]HAS6577047.1 hypothetical protein [Vibrio parahaemolyticus]